MLVRKETLPLFKLSLQPSKPSYYNRHLSFNKFNNCILYHPMDGASQRHAK